MPSLTASPTGGGGVAVNAGEILVLSGTADSIASGGDYLTAGTITRQIGFAGVTAAGALIALPRTAVYNVELHFAWDSYAGGGTVELEIAGVTRRVHPDNGTGTRFEWSAVIDATVGEVLKVKVTHGDPSALTATWEMTVAAVEPISTSALDAQVLFGYDAEAGGTSSVTLSGTSGIDAGVLLLAFIAAAEPNVTTPAGFTTIDTQGTGDEKYLVQTRTAQAGDASASWTWTADGGVAVAKSLGVTIVVLDAVSVDGAVGYSRGAPVTSLALSTTTTAAAGQLVCSVKSTGGPPSASGMTKVHEAIEVSNEGTTEWHSVFLSDVSAGTHNVSVSAASGLIQAHLVGTG